MFENGAEIYQGDVLEPEKYFRLPQKKKKKKTLWQRV
jgi:hypothetical protein